MPNLNSFIISGSLVSALCLIINSTSVVTGFSGQSLDVANLKKSVNYQQPANEVCSPITLSQSQIDSLTTRADSLILFGAEKITLACDYLA